MNTFGINFRKLLFQKIEVGKPDIPTHIIVSMKLIYQEVDGEMRYFIDDSLLQEIPDEIMEEVEALWISGRPF